MLHDISNVPSNLKTYGGLACTKIGVTLDGIDYLVKYPTSTKAKNFKNTSLLYLNNSVSEYLGSKIFKLFGLPVHNVSLVFRNEKLCALCEDFVKSGRLVEFRELKSTYEPGFINPDGNMSDGSGTDLEETLLVIRNHPILRKLEDYEDYFWKIFIIDALIGNHDRNNGNYGIIIDGTCVNKAPVYDNGNCLNPSWSDSKMQYYLDDIQKMFDVAYKVNTCRFTLNGKPINPFHLISSGKYKNCTEALRIIDNVSVTDIVGILNSCTVLNETQKRFFTVLLRFRLQHLKEILMSLTSCNFSEYYITKVKATLDKYDTDLMLSDVLVRLPSVELDDDMLVEVIQFMVR